MTIRVSNEKRQSPLTSAEIQTNISCRLFGPRETAEAAMVSLSAAESENAILRAHLSALVDEAAEAAEYLPNGCLLFGELTTVLGSARAALAPKVAS